MFVNREHFFYAAMIRGKRGRYLNYLQNKQNEPKTKIPRQTIWNRRNRERRMQNDFHHEQQQFESMTVSIENMSPSIVANDDSLILNDSMNIVNQTVPLEEQIAEFNQEDISIVCDDDESEILNNISDCLDETEIQTIYEESENEICVDYFRKIHNSLECTVADAYSMIYAYSVRHNLNWTAVEDLIHLVNSIIGKDSLHPSKYMFRKMFKPKEKFTSNVHFWCQVCEKYFGVKQDTVDPVCLNCSNVIVTDTKYHKNHFVSMPIKDQLKNMLEQNSEKLIFNSNSSSRDMTDVHDSQNYQRLKSEMENTPYITLTIYTDGAAVFKSTKDKSLWPICVFINEICLDQRFKRENILCTALSFGKTPNMRMFFKPLIEEIKTINSEGGIHFRNKTGELKIVRVIPMMFTADALAKAYVLNITQHNGHYGCPYCLHSGTNIEGTTQIRYCNEDKATNRTNKKSREDMIAAHCGAESVNGYKGVSPLIALENFDIIWQVVIDKMHNVDMGVTKKLFDLFLNSKYRGERY